MARVEITEDALNDLEDLDGDVRAKVIKAINKLRVDPEKRGQPLGSRPGSNLTMFRKLVVGNRDYRVVFRVEPDGTLVIIWVIAKRADEECYELAVARLKLHGDREMAQMATALLEHAWRRPGAR